MSHVTCIRTNEKVEKPIEFTHIQKASEGWVPMEIAPRIFSEVKYLGRCKKEGDMFVAYLQGYVYIFKGHLNSGKILTL